MRVLLLHPEDSPLQGPWATQQWDLIVDLGKSSPGTAAYWEQRTRSRVLRSEMFRRGLEDIRAAREMLFPGRGLMMDELGIDWWDLTMLLVSSQAETVTVLSRLAPELSADAEFWTTRDGWPANIIGILLRVPLRVFSPNALQRGLRRLKHYPKLWGRFSRAQIQEILFDKYDPAYKWRAKISTASTSLPGPLILLPSAYGNVSRMAASYARLLPKQSFLLVATRESAKQFEPPANVQVRDLSQYAGPRSRRAESSHLVQQWQRMKDCLRAHRDFEIMDQAGVLNEIPTWTTNGLAVRDAWREVLDRESVSAVLCGDDSNIYTRLPVMLASRRKIPTVDFHHGAMDGRYLLKDLPCDVYLAKNEMERDYLLRVCRLPSERVAMGAATAGRLGSTRRDQPPLKKSVVLFSEPYENAMMRAEEVYRELLPQLCRVARKQGCGVVIKLHPFESAPERKKLVRTLLSDEDHGLVTVIDGPLSEQLLSQTWFGITGESTTVVDCLLQGIPCFLMGWLTLSPYGYVDQYARFGLGEIVESVDDVQHLPRRLENFRYPDATQTLWKMADPDLLQQWLGVSSPARPSVSRVS
jgi:hypothetical protein